MREAQIYILKHLKNIKKTEKIRGCRFHNWKKSGGVVSQLVFTSLGGGGVCTNITDILSVSTGCTG